MQTSARRRVLALDRYDNVANALEAIAAGDEIDAQSDQTVVARTPVPLGHKVALVSIRAGEPVVKYGEPIGLARSDIAPGEHVHTHNVDRLFADWLTARTGAVSE